MSKVSRCALIIGMFLASYGEIGGAIAADQPASTVRLIASCEGCHGKDGNSTKGDVPRLNGQHSSYILRRLIELRDPSKNTPHAGQMVPISAMSDADAAMVASYFEHQTPTSAAGMGFFYDAGAAIYLHGAEPAIPACATCHGRDGEGLGEVPRIKGQHEDYLLSQLSAFTSGKRVGSPMNRHAWDMTLEQRRQLSTYLSNN